MSSCVGNVIAPTSTLPGPAGAPWRSALTFSVTLRDELVVDRRLDVDALDRDAGLAAVLHRVVDGGVGGALEVGVGEHDHRVLAAELERHRGERARGALHDLLAGRGRAGEHHHVDLVDQRLRRSRRRPVATWKTPSGRPHSRIALGHQQRGERRDLGRLEDDRVAGGQRRDAVAEGVRQRVVPRARSRRRRRAARSGRRACGRARTGWRSGPSRRRGTPARSWPRSRTRWRRSRSRRAGRPRGSCRSRRRSCRSRGRWLSSTHFWARRSTRARPSKPSASQAGCAARPRSASARTSSAERIGTCADDLRRWRGSRPRSARGRRRGCARRWPSARELDLLDRRPAPAGGRARRSAAPRARRRPPCRRSPCRRPCACRRATARPRW